MQQFNRTTRMREVVIAAFATVQSRGQVTIPRDVRKAAGAEAGDTVSFTQTSSDTANLHVERDLTLDEVLRWWRVDRPVDMKALREEAEEYAAQEVIASIKRNACQDRTEVEQEEAAVTALAKMQARGQITVPRKIRRAVGIEPGTPVLLRAIGPATIEMSVIPRLTIDDLVERYPIKGLIDEEADREAWQAEAAKDVIGRG